MKASNFFTIIFINNNQRPIYYQLNNSHTQYHIKVNQYNREYHLTLSIKSLLHRLQWAIANLDNNMTNI